MSLIKSVDVPKHMADRLRSRRIAARLSGGAKQPAVPATKPLAGPRFVPVFPPTRRRRPNCLAPPSCRTSSRERTAAFLGGRPRFAPDFLSNLVALPKFMRLSLRKAAHAGECRVAGNAGRPGAPIHPKDEHKSVPWVQDTAWARDLWCVSTSFHTDSPSALAGFPVKLGDVGKAYANVARQEIRAQGAFFCSRPYFGWVHTEATRRDARDALRCCTAVGNPMSGSRK